MNRIKQALDARKTPLDIFFRDDDAGWSMAALDAMLQQFAEAGCPVDLAVIPAVLSNATARHVTDWRNRHPVIGLHQHGYAHVNYEADGARKCEFGSARPIERQCADIMIGRERLQEMIGPTDPIFTPPWNRCLPETVARMRAIGFRGFSADYVIDQGSDLPTMIPITFDWDRMRRGGELEARLAAALDEPAQQLGIMLHHATLALDQLHELRCFLNLITAHPAVSIRPMRHFLEC
jgi:hypothetical protein